MSSDPIEVLRELEAKLNRLEDKYREAIKGRDAADPLTNHRLGLAEGFGVAAMCVRDALASLSAPKPESAEAVAWIHPDSIGALESAPDGAWLRVFTRGAPPPEGGGWRPITFADTAPPRPEASAPVGVERVVEAMRMLSGVGIPVKPECIGRWADQLEALAQQPAAVDGAVAGWSLRHERGMIRVIGPDGRSYAAVDPSLAGQHQGGTPE